MTTEIVDKLDRYRERVDRALQNYLPAKEHTGTTLEAAMHYATLNGGKRVRPVLVYATGRAFGADLNICLLYTSPSPRDGLLSRMPSSA